jgi:hypothetical protein
MDLQATNGGNDMDTGTAIATIKDLVFRPGWEFECEPFTHRFQNTLKLRVRYTAISTDRDAARNGYPEELATFADKVIMLDECETVEHLMVQVLTFIREIDFHEATETLRLRTADYDAPFHPHRSAGIARLVKYFGGTKEDYLRFGLA